MSSDTFQINPRYEYNGGTGVNIFEHTCVSTRMKRKLSGMLQIVHIFFFPNFIRNGNLSFSVFTIITEYSKGYSFLKISGYLRSFDIITKPAFEPFINIWAL